MSMCPSVWRVRICTCAYVDLYVYICVYVYYVYVCMYVGAYVHRYMCVCMLVHAVTRKSSAHKLQLMNHRNPIVPFSRQKHVHTPSLRL